MKVLNICLDLEIDSTLNGQSLADFLSGCASEIVVNCGNRTCPEENWIHVNCTTDNIRSVMGRVYEYFEDHPEFKRASIVCCQGDLGWDDYLLLFHYDKGQQGEIDILPSE